MMKLNIQMFASTNKTANYELPQFVGTDKPTWLGDFNTAMATIDGGMAKNKSNIESMDSRVSSAEATASQASQNVSALTTRVDSVESSVSSATTTANNAQSTANSALNVANTKVNTSDLFDLVYPVGSIYLSVNNTSPATLFGGTWEKIKGRMIIGYNEEDKDFNTLGNTGGSKTHTQTVEELAQHNHAYSKRSDANAFGPYELVGHVGGGNIVLEYVSNTGNNKPMDIMNPYYVANIWHRVA